MDKRQQIEHTLVTGANSGIGLAFARALAARGEALVLVGRNRARLATVARELVAQFGIPVRTLVLDLARAGAGARLHERCGKAGVRIGTLINNAGIGLAAGPQHAQDPAAYRQLFRLNCETALDLATLFGRDMAARGHGRIVNVASTASFQAMPFAALYGASKSFLLSLSEAMHVELKPLGVTVTAVCPGITDTNFFKHGKPKVPGWLYPLITPERVAAKALQALDRGRPTVIPSFRHWLFAQVARFLPRRLLLGLMFFIEKRRKGMRRSSR